MHAGCARHDADRIVSGRMSAEQFVLLQPWRLRRLVALGLFIIRFIQLHVGNHNHRRKLQHRQARRLRQLRSQFLVTLLVRKLKMQLAVRQASFTCHARASGQHCGLLVHRRQDRS